MSPTAATKKLLKRLEDIEATQKRIEDKLDALLELSSKPKRQTRKKKQSEEVMVNGQ